MRSKKLIVITGPTASGKSALAVSLAHRLNAEIISADSRQIYKGIPIVTAVPTESEKEGIHHHLLEVLRLEDYYSASMFEQDVLKITDKLFKSGDFAIVCGGSMMYIDSLVYGIDDIPTVPVAIRNKLMDEWKENGNEWLLEKLKALDYEYYNKVDLRNLKRVFHAVEVSLTANVPYSSLLVKERPLRDFEILKVCLTGDRSFLFDRINNRVIQMLENGLEDEAHSVYHLRHLNSLNTVGLKEMFDWFDGKMTKEEAISRIQKNTRVYAKKQETWHKRDNNALRIDFKNSRKENVKRIIETLNL